METLTNFSVPSRNEVSVHNQAIFDNLQKGLGFVPNLYAYLAKNETALSDYLTLQNRKSSLRAKEREVINLVTSQVNDCHYCIAAHTALGKLNGFTDEQILAIRRGQAPFDHKLDSLVTFTKAVVEGRGRVSPEAIEAFFSAGYSEANLIDVVMTIGDKIITNYLHNLTNLEIDFPLADAV
ncbi:carboxymuconolactone decarboxylase family protein [Spirosoma pomorum]